MHGVPLIISARADLAAAVQAAGVQLPETGLDVAGAHAAFPSLAVGRSCHDRAGLLTAQRDGADSAWLAPIATPLSKPGTAPAMGVAGFAALIRGLRIPVFALGGVDPPLAAELVAAGAAGVAVIGSGLAAPVPTRAIRDLVEAVHG